MIVFLKAVDFRHACALVLQGPFLPRKLAFSFVRIARACLSRNVKGNRSRFSARDFRWLVRSVPPKTCEQSSATRLSLHKEILSSIKKSYEPKRETSRPCSLVSVPRTFAAAVCIYRSFVRTICLLLFARFSLPLPSA